MHRLTKSPKPGLLAFYRIKEYEPHSHFVFDLVDHKFWPAHSRAPNYIISDFPNSIYKITNTHEDQLLLKLGNPPSFPSDGSDAAWEMNTQPLLQEMSTNYTKVTLEKNMLH